MRKAGESENFGTEQEHLNQVFGAQLTNYRDAGEESVPGIQFLKYLTPRDGRPIPKEIKANDLVHWQTIINNGRMLNLIAKKLRNAHVPFVSSGVVSMPKDKAGFSKGALVSDPDGHSVLLIQK